MSGSACRPVDLDRTERLAHRLGALVEDTLRRAGLQHDDVQGVTDDVVQLAGEAAALEGDGLLGPHLEIM